MIDFSDNYFDCIVAISSLEFVSDLDRACSELGRVLTSDGSIVVVTPGYSKFLDTSLRLFTGTSAHDDFQNRRETTVRKLVDHFDVSRRISVPPLGARASLYTGLSLHKHITH